MTESPFDKLRTGLRPPAFAYSISSSCQRFENDLIPARSWLEPSQTANATFEALPGDRRTPSPPPCAGPAPVPRGSAPVEGEEPPRRVREHRTVAVVAVLGRVSPLQPECDVLAVVGGLHLEEADGSQRFAGPGGANVPARLPVEGGPAQ